MANSEVERTERRWRENRQGFAFANYADALRKTGDAERALEVLREGLALHPTYLPANIVLGRCYLDIGDDDSAHTAFQRVLSLDAENVIALKALAETSERQSQFGEAERWLQALLIVDRGNEAAREQLARVQEAAIAGPATAVAPAPEEHEAESSEPSFARDGIASIDASELTAAHEHAVSAPEQHAVAVDDGPSLAWVGGAETAADAAPLTLDDLTADTNGSIDLHGTAVESLGDASVDELVAAPESHAEPISLDTPSIDHGESLSDMVEKADEIQLHSATAAEYQVPDASETLTLGDSHTPALDLGIERSSPDAVDVGGAIDASSLLEPEHDSTSAVDASLPSMLSETVDGATVELASSMHHDAFVADFEATHVELPALEPVAPPESLVEVTSREEPAVPTVPAPRLAVANPVHLAAMPREEILESFRRAAEVRAADVAARPPAPAPESVVAEAVAAVAPEPIAAVVEPAVVIADEAGEVWESPEFGDDVPMPEVVAAVAPAPVDTAPVLAVVQAHAGPEPEIELRRASATPAFAEHDADGAAPELVVTEAMAALYEAQGHRADAREVYRQLALRHPGEARFASKVAALADAPSAPAPPPAIAYAAAATGGQSVGLFLGSLLRLAPPAFSRNGHHAAAQAGGQPTRPATDPVSLHGMFGEDRPAASATSKPGVATARPQSPSLDEFYGGASSSDAGADQDLEQFHAWLQSLKA